MRKLISILGSTGSVGLSTLRIVDKKKSFLKVNLLSANKNLKLISNQIKKYNPKYIVISDHKAYKKVKKKFKKKKFIILNNFSFLKKIKSDITVSAIPGLAGLQPTLSMIKFSKKLLLANKESVICGWHLINKEAKKNKTKIVPVDSEHFSILKLLESHKLSEIDKIYITASGGPFLNLKMSQFKNIKPKDALKHPKWKMGKKITVDSSTMMNKIFEIFEAQKMFNIPSKMLEILIHPESLVHAIIKFKNGLSKLLYHETSMIIPIANAIFDDRLNIKDFLKQNKKQNIIKNLSFVKVNKKIFPVVNIKNKISQLPSTPIIINASNEILVDEFLRKKIPFLSIIKVILAILSDRNFKKYAIRKPKNISQIYLIDKWARQITLDKIQK